MVSVTSGRYKRSMTISNVQEVTTMTRRQIFITEDDMARLREMVRRGRMVSRRDQNHLPAHLRM